MPARRKIFNDPVYGFISIPSDLIYEIIETPIFQRLRRIHQLGVANLIYPSALHTRFAHALGTIHLMQQALETIKSKGHQITEDEQLGATVAILLHDIGHAPFSHALENSIISDFSHEEISLHIMKHLNNIFNNKLDLAIEIYTKKYKKNFLVQLVSGQLDLDRLDYLTRDSFYTGVLEGVIGTERILKMIDVYDNSLVIEEKGIYSIEKFLIARQLMFWQVYLHKTAVSAETLLIKILQRAKYLFENGINLPCSENLIPFLKTKVTKETFLNNEEYLKIFSQLDDFDIIASVKMWVNSNDYILSKLSRCFLERKLFKTIIYDNKLNEEKKLQIQKYISKKLQINNTEVNYFFHYGTLTSQVYDAKHNPIYVLYKNKKVEEISKASKTLSMGLLTSKIERYFLWFPKELVDDITKILES